MKSKIILECPECKHQWLETLELPMRTDVAVQRIRGYDMCPKCGKRKVDMLLGDRYKQALKELT